MIDAIIRHRSTNEHKSKGFSGILVILAILLVGIVGVIGWRVHTNVMSGDTLEPSSAPTKTTTVSPLVFHKEKLPTGWSVDDKEAGAIQISNQTNGCFVGAIYTSDTAESNSPSVDHLQQTVDTIKSKGFTVEQSKSTITIQTTHGGRVLDGASLNLTGQDNPMFQKYAFISTTAYYVNIQLSCNQQSDISTSEQALTAITFTKL